MDRLHDFPRAFRRRTRDELEDATRKQEAGRHHTDGEKDHEKRGMKHDQSDGDSRPEAGAQPKTGGQCREKTHGNFPDPDVRADPCSTFPFILHAYEDLSKSGPPLKRVRRQCPPAVTLRRFFNDGDEIRQSALRAGDVGLRPLDQGRPQPKRTGGAVFYFRQLFGRPRDAAAQGRA